MEENKILPTISIVTPSFNQSHFLEETIISVLKQSYPKLQYIIIDGGSSDGSVEIIKKYESRLAFWVSEADRGQSHAINKGLALATGEVVTWLNSDDYYEPDTLRVVGEAFNNSSVFAVNGDCNMVDSRGKFLEVVRPGRVTFSGLLRYWNFQFCPPQPSIFFRKSIIDQTGMLDENLRYAMDYELWLRIARQHQFGYIGKTFSNYRLHDQSKSVGDGGFANFIPEWKEVSHRYVAQSRLSIKLQFAAFYLSYRLLQAMSKISQILRSLRRRLHSR